jgi:hypothetical protein
MERGMTDFANMNNNQLDAKALQNDTRQTEGFDIICLADVQPKSIEWLWRNWLAIGKLSMLAGEGGKGKSTVLCDFAARTTKGD